ncbi:hypothetical protein BU17DRAFT_64617 [Hysterangium stoloniferum]|nr:hypothetical protein BU17DRAFT_64617 [Hysterangium stoloniferum]
MVQQQEPVQNTQCCYVDPISPKALQPWLRTERKEQSRSKEEKTTNTKKRKVREVEEKDGAYKPFASKVAIEKKYLTRTRVPAEKKLVNRAMPTTPGRRSKAYIELPTRGVLDMTQYEPVSPRDTSGHEASNAKRARLDHSDILGSCSPLSTPPSSPLPHRRHLEMRDDRVNDIKSRETHATDSTMEIDASRNSPDPVADLLMGFEKTLCHQCRNSKCTYPKLRCRKLVSVMFCDTKRNNNRYGEVFDLLDPSWHCPRCRGICNCSNCLRKGGYGYIIDTGISSKFSVHGRRIAEGQLKKAKGRGAHKTQPESMRQWLAREGLIFGTEEWMAEQRRRGFRYVIGKNPPPRDRPSPYREARFNPMLQALEDGDEVPADPVVVPPVDGTDTEAAPPGDEIASGPPITAPVLENTPINGPSSDLPGLTQKEISNRKLRLVVGRNFVKTGKPPTKKHRLKQPAGVTKRKSKAKPIVIYASESEAAYDDDPNDSEYHESKAMAKSAGKTITIKIPSRSLRGTHMAPSAHNYNPTAASILQAAVPVVNKEVDDEDISRHTRSPSPAPRPSPSPFRPSPPPPEPVLVSTEQNYALPTFARSTYSPPHPHTHTHTHASSSFIPYGLNARALERERNGDSDPILPHERPLYTAPDELEQDDPYRFAAGIGPFGFDCGTSAGAGAGVDSTPSASTSYSTLHTPDGYLTSHVRGDDIGRMGNGDADVFRMFGADKDWGMELPPLPVDTISFSAATK